MNIEKLDKETFHIVKDSIKNYLQAWHIVPHNVELDNIKIERIRYIKQWRTTTPPEDAFIIEFSNRRELLGRFELGLSIERYKTIIEEQNKNLLLFAKDLVTKQEWYEYPIVWGTLDEEFDDAEDYEADGKYEGDMYQEFNKKYD